MPQKRGVGRIRKRGRQGSDEKRTRRMPTKTDEQMPAAPAVVDVADNVVDHILNLVLDGEIEAVLIRRDKELNAAAREAELAWRAMEHATALFRKWVLDHTTEEEPFITSDWDEAEEAMQWSICGPVVNVFELRAYDMRRKQAAWGESMDGFGACGCWRPCDCDQEAAAALIDVLMTKKKCDVFLV